MTDDFTLDNLNVNSYRVEIQKLPLFNFKVKSVSLPSLTLEPVHMPNHSQRMVVPGDTVSYGTFTMTFIVDENLYNYLSIVNWMEGLGFPDTFEQFRKLISPEYVTNKKPSYVLKETCDVDVHLLTNHRNSNKILKIFNAFPTSLSGIELNNSNTDSQTIEATVDFAFTGMKYAIEGEVF